MGRITINGTQAGFSCKKEVSLALWDVKTNRAKGKSEEARTLNQELDNIKAQITRHYQYICDHDSFVTAKKVYNRYVGFSEECHTLMNLFREQLEPYKKKIGIEKAESTYCGLVADYKSLLLFMKSKKNAEDIVIEELEKSFIEDYYNWMLGTCALANSTVFGRVNTLKWLMYIAQEKGWIRVHPFASFECMPEYKRRSFLSEEGFYPNPRNTPCIRRLHALPNEAGYTLVTRFHTSKSASMNALSMNLYTANVTSFSGTCKLLLINNSR